MVPTLFKQSNNRLVIPTTNQYTERMKNEIPSAVAAEIEALNLEIKELKEALQLIIETTQDCVYATRGFKESRLMTAYRLTL
jgi:hypothetical protein